MPVPHKTKSLARQSVKEKIYETLKGWIIDGTLEPGEQIIDSELAKYFDVSRTPVREALQMLETQKLVEVIPGKSTIVTPMEVDNIGKWYLPLAALQALAAEIACDIITEEQLEQLEQLNSEFEHCIKAGNVTDILHADTQFHNYIVKIVNNEYIYEFSEILYLHIERYIQCVEFAHFSNINKIEASLKGHETIIKALKARDKVVAAESTKRNWLSTL